MPSLTLKVVMWLIVDFHVKPFVIKFSDLQVTSHPVQTTPISVLSYESDMHYFFLYIIIPHGSYSHTLVLQNSQLLFFLSLSLHLVSLTQQSNLKCCFVVKDSFGNTCSTAWLASCQSLLSASCQHGWPAPFCIRTASFIFIYAC